MEMQDVKILSPPAHLLKHSDMQAIGIPDRTVEAQRARPDRLKLRRGAGIAAGKQRDIVAQPHELLREPGDHAFSTTIELRRNSFSERRYLRNTHGISDTSAHFRTRARKQLGAPAAAAPAGK